MGSGETVYEPILFTPGPMKIVKMKREDPRLMASVVHGGASSVFLKNISWKPPRGALRGGSTHRNKK